MNLGLDGVSMSGGFMTEGCGGGVWFRFFVVGWKCVSWVEAIGAGGVVRPSLSMRGNFFFK